MIEVSTRNLDQVSDQQVFDKVAVHLLTQNKVSRLSPDLCAYRDGNGNMCAAGCLIPDDVYDSGMECNSWDYLVKDRGFSTAHEHLIDELQIIHDANDPEWWKQKLEILASRFNLNIDAIDNFEKAKEQH